MHPRSRRIAATILAVGVGSFSLVACSKDESPTNPATPSEAAPSTAAPTTAAKAAAGATSVASAPQEGANIFYTAVAAGSFLTLAKLLIVSDLLDTIKTGGPFTVFAPTDTAFAAVPPKTLEALLADKEELKKVLLYHVVPGVVKAADLKTGDTATAEGSALKVTSDGLTIKVNDATVAAADVMATNGVIHVIDKVLLPPDLG